MILDDPPEAALNPMPAQHLEDDVFGADPVGQAAGEVHAPNLRHPEMERLAGHDECHLHAAGAEGQHAQQARSRVWLSDPTSAWPGLPKRCVVPDG